MPKNAFFTAPIDRPYLTDRTRPKTEVFHSRASSFFLPFFFCDSHRTGYLNHRFFRVSDNSTDDKHICKVDLKNQSSAPLRHSSRIMVAETLQPLLNFIAAPGLA